jgi:hypothetical protein
MSEFKRMCDCGRMLKILYPKGAKEATAVCPCGRVHTVRTEGRFPIGGMTITDTPDEIIGSNFFEKHMRWLRKAQKLGRNAI